MQENDKDSFWDIDKLVPKKSHTLAGFSTKEKTNEHTGNQNKSNGHFDHVQNFFTHIFSFQTTPHI